MKKLKNTYLISLVILSIAVSIYTSFIINDSNFDNNFEKCQFSERTIQKNYSPDVNFEIINIDTYVFPEVKNIFCIGKVESIQKKSENFFTLKVASNQKLHDYLKLVFLFIFSVGMYVDKSKISPIIFLYNISNFSLNILFNENGELSFIIKSNIFLFLFLFFISSKSKYFSKKVSFLIPLVIIFYITYLNSELITNSFRLNGDNYIWLFGAIRMMEFDNNFFDIQWDNKGFLILYIYRFFLFQTSLDIWSGYFYFYILFIFIAVIMVYNLLKNIVHPNIAILISLLSYLELFGNKSIWDNGIDTRFIGSIIILFNLLLYFKNKPYYVGILFAILLLNLISFVIVVAALLIAFYFNDVTKFKKILSSFLTSIFFLTCFLLINNQLENFYITNILLPLITIDAYQYPFIEIINRNLTYIIFFGISTFYFKSINKNYINKFVIVYFWILGELTHVYLTGPRAGVYDTLLKLPSLLLSAIVLDFIYKKIKLNSLTNRKFNNIKNASILIVIFLVLNLSLIDSLGLETLNSNYNNNFQNKFKIQSMSGIVLNKNITYSDDQFIPVIFLATHAGYDYFFTEYKFIPSSRVWLNHFHLRNSQKFSKFNWDKFISDDEFKIIYENDIRIESPRYLIINQDYGETYLSLISKYRLEEELIECINNHCIYNIKK